MLTSDTLKSFLVSTDLLLKAQAEHRRLRGERFNIFSILKMERQENATHSAFLANLLDPKGSHEMGNCFLKLFLTRLPFETALDVSTVQVRTEVHIETVDYVEKTGGRIDILLKDRGGNYITIENKIYAGDGVCQIERYCNYKPGKNKVLYLTLYGNEASLGSRDQKQVDTDYFLISYRDHIISWLQACQKESADWPILRETIKQYIILLKKMTGTMDKTEQKELDSLIFDYYESANYIANRFYILKQKMHSSFRKNVTALLNEAFSNGPLKNRHLTADDSAPITAKYAGIEIRQKDFPKARFYFRIQSFNCTRQSGDLFIGLCNPDRYIVEPIFNGTRNDKLGFWAKTHYMEFKQLIRINLDEHSSIRMLARDENLIAHHVTAQAIKFIETWVDQIEKWNRTIA